MKSLRNMPIGVFDSGVGGLTVARSIAKQLPDEDIIYFGDTARVPYGNKSQATVIRFSREIMTFLMKKRVKMVVVACNTASSLSLSAIKRNYSIPVIGVIAPGVKEAVRVSRNKRIGVIGTESTISSGSYERELAGNGRSYRLFSKSCPLFVPLVENNVINGNITYQIAEGYLKSLKTKRIDTLIMGCTHYPLLRVVIKKVMGSTRLVDSSFAVTKEVKEILLRKGMRASQKTGRGRVRCFVSDDVKGFSKVANLFFKDRNSISVKKVVL